jgi:hemerythrin-like domain-containing protein
MRAIASLTREHEVISRLAAAHETYAHRLERQESVEAEDLARFVQVFEDLGDRIHHEKEENILLPLLSRNGVDWDRGVIDDVQTDHRQERYLMDVLFQASERAGAWDNEHRRHIATSAKALVEFQRRHHELENRLLFPEVALLSGSAQSELESALETFDAELGHRNRRDRAIAMTAELARIYLTEPGTDARPDQLR